jgi:hypothetical protein
VLTPCSRALLCCCCCCAQVPQWQTWLTEVAVGLRTVLLNLPYGDQALFVQREALEAVQVRAGDTFGMRPAAAATLLLPRVAKGPRCYTAGICAAADCKQLHNQVARKRFCLFCWMHCRASLIGG